MKLEEIEKIQSRPEYANRATIYVYEENDGLTAVYEGTKYHVDMNGPMGCLALDAKMSKEGVHVQRNFFLIDKEDLP